MQGQAAFTALGLATGLRHGLDRGAGLAALVATIIIIRLAGVGRLAGNACSASGRANTINFRRGRCIGRNALAGTRRTRRIDVIANGFTTISARRRIRIPRRTRGIRVTRRERTIGIARRARRIRITRGIRTVALRTITTRRAISLTVSGGIRRTCVLITRRERAIALRTISTRRAIALPLIAARLRTLGALVVARCIGTRGAFVAESRLLRCFTNRRRSRCGLSLRRLRRRRRHGRLRRSFDTSLDGRRSRRLWRLRNDRRGFSSGGTGGRRAGVSGLAFLIGERSGDGTLASVLFFLTQIATGALRALGALRRTRGLGLLRTIDIRCRRAHMPRCSADRRRTDTALGFHHHRLGTAMAEALLDGARRNIAADTRLQRQRCPLTI